MGRLLIVVSLCLSGVLALMNAAPAEADLFHVLTGETCNYDGLANAIVNAKSGDIITFDCTLNVIDFSSNINIPTDLTIDGSNNGNPMVFQGNTHPESQTRLLTAVDVNLTLLNLTLRNGSSALGGAIAIQNGTLRIYQCKFLHNINAEQIGGAIYGDGTAIDIYKSVFQENSAATGGAIALVNGSLQISQSTFTGNQVINPQIAIAGGGAIVVQNTVTTISQSRFEGNSAPGSGGAVLSIFKPLEISHTSFISNSAASGGAITAEILTVTGSTFSGNIGTQQGSAIFAITGEISWSTIVQPRYEDTVPIAPALQISGPTFTLTGVILAGEDDHCSFNPTATSLSVEHTLANDNSCDPDSTESWENIDVPLGALTDLTLYGVTQSYYPLDITGTNPALNAAGDACIDPDDLFSRIGVDQIGTIRAVNGCDIGAIEYPYSQNLPASITSFSTDPQPAHEGMATAPEFTVDNDSPAQGVFTAFECDIDDAVDGIEPGGTVTCFYPTEGVYFLYGMVYDGQAISSTVFAVHVLNANPVITNFTATPSQLTPGGSTTLSYAATDIDDPLTFAVDCGGGTLVDPTHCQFTTSGEYTISLLVTDSDGGSSQSTVIVIVADPSTLCIDSWTGQISMATSDSCSRSQTLVQLPQPNFQPITLCVNTWNGATRADLANRGCSRSEHAVSVDGTATVSVCINNWNNTIRISDTCSRSEHSDML